MPLIEPGKKAPAFSLPDQDSKTRALDGKVVRRWDGVKVTGHAEEVLAAVQAL